MAEKETWEEVRYHVLGQLPALNRKIDSLDAKVGQIETKFETGMAVLTTKMVLIMSVGSLLIGLLVQVVTHLLGMS
jgi:hypothetical protein